MAQKKTIKAETSDFNVPEIITPETKPKNKIFKKLGPKKLSIIVLIIIALVGVFFSFYFYHKYQTLKTNPTVETQKETAKLVSTLEKLMELPQNETPTIATISDKNKLKDQPFFAQAENGDILFAYTTAMKAILYRPSSNKIINVAPISINQNQDLNNGTTKTIPPPTNNKQ